MSRRRASQKSHDEGPLPGITDSGTQWQEAVFPARAAAENAYRLFAYVVGERKQ